MTIEYTGTPTKLTLIARSTIGEADIYFGDDPSSYSNTGEDEQSEGYDITVECATPEGITNPSSFPATYKTDAEGCIEIPIVLADGWEMIKTSDPATNATVFYPSVDYPKDEDGLVIPNGYGYDYDENKIYINHTTCSWRIVLRPT